MKWFLLRFTFSVYRERNRLSSKVKRNRKYGGEDPHEEAAKRKRKEKKEAGDKARTRNILLGKQALLFDLKNALLIS